MSAVAPGDVPLSPEARETLAHWSALAPVALVVALWAVRRPASWAWLVIALAYAVSWATDKVSGLTPEARLIAYNSYVMLQAGIIVAVVASRRWVASGLILLYALTGMWAVAHLGPQQLVPLHVVCWGSVAILGLLEGGPTGWPLFVSFGVVLYAWLRWQMDVTSFDALGGFLWARVLGTLLVCVMLVLRRRWVPIHR